MDAANLQARRGEVRIVDVRAASEWEEGHIEGALHVPEGELLDRVAELRPGPPIVTVCRSGDRSGEAAARLRAAGLDADSLAGGLEAWVQAGGALASSHDHPGSLDGHGHLDDDAVELEHALVELLSAVQEHFGDHEPTEEELKAFLRQRLEDEGRDAEEIDEIIASL